MTTKMTKLEILKKARELIAPPDRWCQRAFGRLANGDSVSSLDEGVCQWCSTGAIVYVSANLTDLVERLELQSEAVTALKMAAEPESEFTWDPVFKFNDNHTHSEVLGLFDKAIACAEAVCLTEGQSRRAEEIGAAVTALCGAAYPDGNKFSCASVYNDTHSHDEVLAMFDRSIAALEK